ncbi:MAG: PKD domain-containing protein [Acidobacteriota bacterium]
MTWPKNAYLDRTAFGDTLADFADLGGKVVLGGFCWYTYANPLGGRILTGGLAPLDTTTGANHREFAHLGAHVGGHPLLTGVTSVSSPFRDYTALASGATWVADWDDGEKFLALKGNVAAVNGGLMDVGFTGDMARIVRNAVKFLALVNILDMGASATTGSAPFTTTFHGSAAGGQPPYGYLWEFGDGTSSTAQNPSHTYAAAGSYLAQFFVTDSAGHESRGGFYVTVTPPLTLSASRTPASGTAPLAVSFSSAPSGGTPPYTFDWNWGDGSAHGTTQNPSHTFTTGGTYTTILTVTDAAGHTASQTLTTTVLPALQAFAGGSPSSGSIPLSVTFFAFATGGTPPYTYAWNFGDGATATGSSASHTYTAAGSYSATVTVTDGASRTATSAPVPITATVPPPVVTSMVKKSPPFKIVVNGSNLQSGIQVYINGTHWPGVSWKSTSKIVLTGSTLKTAVPPGTPTTFRFVNPDGGETTLTWSY